MVEEFAFDNTEERRKNRLNGTGWVEVIVGSMFSGKSEELIRRLNRAAHCTPKGPGIQTRHRFALLARRDRLAFRPDASLQSGPLDGRNDGEHRNGYAGCRDRRGTVLRYGACGGSKPACGTR